MLINLPVSVTTRNMSYEGDCAQSLGATDRDSLLRYASDIWFIEMFKKLNIQNLS